MRDADSRLYVGSRARLAKLEEIFLNSDKQLQEPAYIEPSIQSKTRRTIMAMFMLEYETLNCRLFSDFARLRQVSSMSYVLSANVLGKAFGCHTTNAF
jgi:hypothetical protein